MSLLTVLLSSLFFFSGFAAAGIYAPDCSLSWEWVCILSFPLYIPWSLSLSDPLALCSDIQQSRPKCLHGRGVHDVHLQRGL